MSNLSARELALAARLDRLSRSYAAAIDQRDPIRFAASFERAEDREVAAWIASAFAYGRVETILATVGRLLVALGPSPAGALDTIPDYRRFARAELAGFHHRFHSARDAAALLYAIARARAEAGSVRAFFEREFRPEERDVGGMLARAVDRIVRFDWRPATGRRALPDDSPVRFFFPSPASGSACKPTDTHVHRVARRLGLTRRKAADWKTAREITDRLARLDPEDPVRYDYALCELGTAGICRPVLAASLCVECPLNAACPAGRRRLTRAA